MPDLLALPKRVFRALQCPLPPIDLSGTDSQIAAAFRGEPLPLRCFGLQDAAILNRHKLHQLYYAHIQYFGRPWTAWQQNFYITVALLVLTPLFGFFILGYFSQAITSRQSYPLFSTILTMIPWLIVAPAFSFIWTILHRFNTVFGDGVVFEEADVMQPTFTTGRWALKLPRLGMLDKPNLSQYLYGGGKVGASGLDKGRLHFQVPPGKRLEDVIEDVIDVFDLEPGVPTATSVAGMPVKEEMDRTLYSGELKYHETPADWQGMLNEGWPWGVTIIFGVLILLVTQSG